MHHFHPARPLAGFNFTLFRLIPIMTMKNERCMHAQKSELARENYSWGWSKGSQPLGTIMLMNYVRSAVMA